MQRLELLNRRWQRGIGRDRYLRGGQQYHAAKARLACLVHGRGDARP